MVMLFNSASLAGGCGQAGGLQNPISFCFVRARRKISLRQFDGGSIFGGREVFELLFWGGGKLSGRSRCEWLGNGVGAS